MNFSTPVIIPHTQHELNYQHTFLLLGSCFSEHIFQKMQERYLHVQSNPFGILYNPASIALCLQQLLAEQELDTTLSPANIEPNYILHHNNLYHSFLHHGSFSHEDKNIFLKNIQASIVHGRQALQEASVLIITFGTAWVYEYQGMIVSNCHRLPASAFTRRRLTVSEIVQTWEPLLTSLALSGKRVICTVSPIRHLKDGLHENQISKSTLLLALDALQQKSIIEYFPAYEILLDELRDYRFFAEDMLHPSAVAVDYVWERFAQTYFAPQTLKKMQELYQVYKDLHHQPLHPDSPTAQAAHQAFRQQAQNKLASLL